VLQANIPNPNVINTRPDTPCPKFPDDEAKAHCHCISNEHTCGFCGEEWH
jgi:hypothetical protein